MSELDGPVRDMIARSSLGTAGARRLRDRSTPEIGHQIVRVAQLQAAIAGGEWHLLDELASIHRAAGRFQEAQRCLRELAQRTNAEPTPAVKAEQSPTVNREPEWLAAELALVVERERSRREGPVENLTPVGKVDAQMVSEERERALREGLAELPAIQRELLLLLAVDPSLSYAEIAASLGVPAGSIGPTRGRALARLLQTAAVQRYADMAAGVQNDDRFKTVE